MNKKDLIEIRHGTPKDEDLIFSTWLKGAYYGWLKNMCKFYENKEDKILDSIPQDAFDKHYSRVISAVLKRSSVNIACLKENPDVILGFSVFNSDTAHWVFVKESWRLIGIAKDLIPPTITHVSHLSPPAKAICFKRGFIFDPFRL